MTLVGWLWKYSLHGIWLAVLKNKSHNIWNKIPLLLQILDHTKLIDAKIINPRYADMPKLTDINSSLTHRNMLAYLVFIIFESMHAWIRLPSKIIEQLMSILINISFMYLLGVQGKVLVNLSFSENPVAYSVWVSFSMMLL